MNTIIGLTILTEETTYKIESRLHEKDRPNANIYLCTDEYGTKYIAKHFYNSSPRANIGLNKYNHYGRRRDGSWRVFKEIRDIGDYNDFLIKHIAREKIEKKWLIILEYINGITFDQFVRDNYNNNWQLVVDTTAELANVLAKWHNAGFAHGDPHLDNAMVEIIDGIPKVTLIDYCQIHHKDFHYCQQFRCFELYDRFAEDLYNDCGKLGKGFQAGIEALESDLDITLTGIFETFYNEKRISF